MSGERAEGWLLKRFGARAVEQAEKQALRAAGVLEGLGEIGLGQDPLLACELQQIGGFNGRTVRNPQVIPEALRSAHGIPLRNVELHR